MKPEIVNKQEMILVGWAFDGSDIQGAWTNYDKSDKAIKHKIDGTYYEWHDWDAHRAMVGVEVTELEDTPEGLSVMHLPAGQYAVFTHKLANGSYEGLNQVMRDWLETGPYKQMGDDSVQVFDDRFKGGNQSDSEIDFWLPVEPK